MTVTALCAVAAAAALTACSDDEGIPQDEVGSTTVTGAAPQSIPSPDADQQEMLLHDLEEVDPRLVADEGQAVDGARQVCLKIRGIEADAGDGAGRSYATRRFGVTDEQAELIVQSVKGTFCDA
ncbi:hypothetical protein [Streptomyces sp. NPDC059009]|uniref:hypothetical protein n=1 Tax=Streptomyces sp. NPDC059009 TaxID=3346694 RepID=UPI00369FBD53